MILPSARCGKFRSLNNLMGVSGGQQESIQLDISARLVEMGFCLSTLTRANIAPMMKLPHPIVPVGLGAWRSRTGSSLKQKGRAYSVLALLDGCYFLTWLAEKRACLFGGGRGWTPVLGGAVVKGYWTLSIRGHTQWRVAPRACGSLSRRPITAQQWRSTCFLGRPGKHSSCLGAVCECDQATKKDGERQSCEDSHAMSETADGLRGSGSVSVLRLPLVRVQNFTPVGFGKGNIWNFPEVRWTDKE